MYHPQQQQQHQQHPQSCQDWYACYQLAWPGQSYRVQDGPSHHLTRHVVPVHYHPSPSPQPHPQQTQTATSPFYHGSPDLVLSACPNVTTKKVMPALVSPLAQVGISGASPTSPQSVTSSSSSVRSTAITPVISSNKALALPVISTAIAATTNNATTQISNSSVVTSKPSRPYTEYTMFYQLEREYIIHRILTSRDDPDSQCDQPALFQNDPLMPARYRSLPLRADWYISGKTKKPTKRKHRKSHGKIGFLELTRMIAARWSTVDDETRKYCKMMAAMELVKYKEDMDNYNAYKEQLSAVGQIPEDMKERMLKKQRAAEKKKAVFPSARSVEKNGVNTSKKRSNAHSVFKTDAILSNEHGILPSDSITVAIEPIAHDFPIRCASSNLDDMEQFISSLVSSPKVSSRKSANNTKSKVITPERSPKKRRLFRDGSNDDVKPSAQENAVDSKVTDEMLVPLKRDTNDDDDHLNGLKMIFSGIDENEIALEFSDHVHSPRNATAKASPERIMTLTSASVIRDTKEISFDYWDALVEGCV